MLRDFLKEGGLYTFSSLVTKGISLLLIPFYTAYFTTYDYGIIDILVVFGAFLNVVISLQLNQGLGRYVAESSYDKEKKRKMASSVIWFVVLVYAVVSLAMIIFPEPFISLLSAETVIPTKTFILSILSVALNGVFYILGVYIRFLRKSKVFAAISFSHAVSNILLTLYLVLSLDYGIDGIYWATIIVTPFVIAVQSYFLRQEILFTFKKHLLSKALVFSIPLVPAALAYLILNFTDRIYIKEFLSFSELGIYGIGSKFASVISIVIVGFSAALAPIVYEKHRDEMTLQQLGRMFRLFIAIGTTGVLVLSMFSYEFLVIFTQEEYYRAHEIMPILYTALLITGLGMFSPGLHIREKTRLIALIVLISASVNVVLNYFLISNFEMIGAALATLLSISINNITLFLSSQKYYPFPIDRFRIIGFTLMFALALYISSYVVPTFDFSYVTLLIIKLTIVGIYSGLLLAAKMVNFKSLKKLRK